MASILKAMGLLAASAVVILLSYALYVLIHYDRLPDGQALTIVDNQDNTLGKGTSYTALTYNIGYGAYLQDFSFFMDYGVTKDGKEIHGFFGRSVSKDHTLGAMEGVKVTLLSLQPDFILLQEVDTDSTRSFHVDEVEFVKEAFPSYSSTYAVNFHSAWLNLPLHNPHGIANSGLLTLSRYKASEATRYSYPITESLDKVTDLDRCFMLQRYPVEGGRDLVLINHHMSAYDKGGTTREKQLKMIMGVLEEEYRKGNYVILAGDFNHSLGEEFLDYFPSREITPGWMAVLGDSEVPEHFRIVKPQNGFETATCRNADSPYVKGESYLCTIDGFIVSDNMVFSSRVVDTDFLYSDHNPVALDFILL